MVRHTSFHLSADLRVQPEELNRTRHFHVLPNRACPGRAMGQETSEQSKRPGATRRSQGRLPALGRVPRGAHLVLGRWLPGSVARVVLGCRHLCLTVVSDGTPGSRPTCLAARKRSTHAGAKFRLFNPALAPAHQAGNARLGRPTGAARGRPTVLNRPGPTPRSRKSPSAVARGLIIR